MSEVQALPVAEVDYKWPDDELVVRLSDYDALAAECERLQLENRHLNTLIVGYEKTLTRVDNMWKKRWLEKTGEPAIALIVDDEFKSYFEQIKDLRAQLEQLQSAPAERGVVVPYDLLVRVLEPVTSEQYINSKHELLALMREFASLNPAPATADSDAREVK